MNPINTIAPTMSSRVIAELTGKRHDNVLRTCRDLRGAGVCPQIEETPYKHPANGETYIEFLLEKRDSLVLVARLSPEFTGAVVDRWLELEAALNAPAGPALPDFTNPVAAARAWADEVEKKQVLEHQLAAAAPALEFVDRFVDATGTMGFRQVCKVLRANENAFRAFLLDKKIAYRLGTELTPHAEHLNAGRFEVKAGVSKKNEHAFNSMRFTTKGVHWVAGEFAKHQLAAQIHHH